MGSGIENGREETSGEGLGCFVFGFFFFVCCFFFGLFGNSVSSGDPKSVFWNILCCF